MTKKFSQQQTIFFEFDWNLQHQQLIEDETNEANKFCESVNIHRKCKSGPILQFLDQSDCEASYQFHINSNQSNIRFIHFIHSFIHSTNINFTPQKYAGVVGLYRSPSPCSQARTGWNTCPASVALSLCSSTRKKHQPWKLEGPQK